MPYKNNEIQKAYQRIWMRKWRKQHPPVKISELKLLKEKAEKYDLLFGD